MEILRLGSTGPYVEMIQLALTRAGFSPGEIDGIFGVRTRNAVVEYQRSRGLEADGVVGVNTSRRLLAYIRGYVTHRIRRGDTFFALAQAYGTTTRAILTANPGLDPENLTVGTTVVIPLGFPLVSGEISYTYMMTELVCEGLKARYPFLRLGSVGGSVMGKRLYRLTLGNGNTRVAYNASFHANEWITTPVLLRFVEDYSRAYSEGGKIYGLSAETLFARTTLYAVPLVNPDGVDLVTGALNSGRYYDGARRIARDFPQIPFPDGWKANILGTDLNLQFPAGWELAREIKFAQGFTSPAPRDYVGSAPLTAPEARAMYDFTRNYVPVLVEAYHTQGEVIYWRWRDREPEFSREIGELFAEASGYALSETPPVSDNAGYKDWFIKDFDRPGYTIEAGLGVSPLPLSQFEKIYGDCLPILTLGLSEAAEKL